VLNNYYSTTILTKMLRTKITTKSFRIRSRMPVAVLSLDVMRMVAAAAVARTSLQVALVVVVVLPARHVMLMLWLLLWRQVSQRWRRIAEELNTID
jgi:hypothetical protein